MTKHTKHQILGILVIMGLIVLALPLFQRHRDISMVNPLKDPPPFPDQSVQVMSPENNDAPVITPPASTQTQETPPPLPSVMSQPAPESVPVEESTAIEKQKVIKPTPSLIPGQSTSSKNSLPTIKPESKPDIKSTTWVIQLGSFKNKANALRLVDKLRSGGYHAFMESSHGNITRVLVGPENKKTEAKKLADQLNSAIHLQGMIVTYKPLTL